MARFVPYVIEYEFSVLESCWTADICMASKLVNHKFVHSEGSDKRQFAHTHSLFTQCDTMLCVPIRIESSFILHI